MSKTYPSLALSLLLILPPTSAALEDELGLQTSIDSAAKSSQEKIDKLDDETSLNLQRYRIASQRQESLEIYTTQLQKLIDSQVEEISSVERQTKEIDDIETGALPLMLEMTAMLGDIVTADVPFLLADREERVEKLKTLIDRADVTAGEKFRRIMEAYLIEVDFGRTIESYRGEIEANGEPKTVDFLRLGRIGLYYQTLDGAESGRWNKESSAWEILDSRARRQIQIGLRIARKQAPPELLTLPVVAPGGQG